MECNRDEATRAMEIAEEKFSLHDVAGAMKFAMKALSLYPELAGIMQLISVLDIHLAAEDKDSNGDMDYYRILQVDASAEELVIKNQYRKLILMVHPDKNHSIGANGAFNLISEAWAVLSDTSKRAMYDQKRRKLGKAIDSQKPFEVTSDESTDNGGSDKPFEITSDESTDNGYSDKTQTSWPAGSDSDCCSIDQRKFEVPRTDMAGPGPGPGPGFSPDRKRKINNAHDRHMTVPDADFYDFDEIRNEDSFEVNQIWASYDDDDGMPRYYARIKKIYSLNPFKVEVTWLEAKHNSDPGLMRWERAGFYKACGEFRFGKGNIIKQVNVFSHVMRWERSNGVLKILPKKGDIWAVYKDWSCRWNETTPKKSRHNYEMVEILRESVQGIGFTVAPLAKVKGFRTLFHRQQQIEGAPDCCDCEVVALEIKNLMRFSHQVPARRLKGNETFNIPRGGCWELDPAALSPRVFQE